MLDGVRVVAIADASGWLAGRILADLGADVVHAEPLGGHPDRARFPWAWVAYGAGARSVVTDDPAPLITAADVVVETGISDRYERLATSRTIWCAVTPFGRTGPKAHARASDLSIQAQSGVLWMTGDPQRAPVRCSAPTSWHHGCADAVAGICIALFHRERTGRGDLVDVSMQEAHVLATMSRVSQFSLSGARGERAGARMRVGDTVQQEIWPCADGHVTFGLRGGPARIPGLKALVAWMAEENAATPALTGRDWDAYNHNDLTQDEVDTIAEPFARFFKTKTMTELYDAALRRGLMLAPANTAREILASKQYAARDLFSTFDGVTVPRVFARGEHLRGARRRAPEPGEHTQEVVRAWALSTA